MLAMSSEDSISASKDDPKSTSVETKSHFRNPLMTQTFRVPEEQVASDIGRQDKVRDTSPC